MAKWTKDPIQFVIDNFNITPDEWQRDALIAIMNNKRVAMKASKGVGKTAVLSMACWWFLATRLDAKVIATSISWDNLSDGLWAEMSKFQQKSELLKSQFIWTKTE